MDFSICVRIKEWKYGYFSRWVILVGVMLRVFRLVLDNRILILDIL